MNNSVARAVQEDLSMGVHVLVPNLAPAGLGLCEAVSISRVQPWPSIRLIGVQPMGVFKMDSPLLAKYGVLWKL